MGIRGMAWIRHMKPYLHMKPYFIHLILIVSIFMNVLGSRRFQNVLKCILVKRKFLSHISNMFGTIRPCKSLSTMLWVSLKPRHRREIPNMNEVVSVMSDTCWIRCSGGVSV